MELHTCAVTGHRPTRFKWKYNEKNNGCKRLKKRMQELWFPIPALARFGLAEIKG